MPEPKRSVSTIKISDGTYFWADTRYYPLLSVRLLTKSTVPLANEFGQWLMPLVDHAESQGLKIIVINDFSRSKLPSTEAREIMARDAKVLWKHPGFGYFVPVVPNPLLRGVLTAVLWLAKSGEDRTHYATGLSDAVAKSLELYRSMNHPLPNITPEAYSFPEPMD